jgi:hypothetical protein
VENCVQSLTIGHQETGGNVVLRSRWFPDGGTTGNVGVILPLPLAALSLLRSRILLKGEEHLGTGDAISSTGDITGLCGEVRAGKETLQVAVEPFAYGLCLTSSCSRVGSRELKLSVSTAY